jgi:hypothetical protein
MISGKSYVYVFVVCGAAEHMNSLHIALAALKQRTRLPVWVVTDESRNEIPIRHDHIIQVNTPSLFTHHQAGIYLKTGLHRFLPKGNLYCYLDSDVLAIGKNPDQIFSHFVSPVLFAKDHYPIFFFSPYALNCGCFEDFQTDCRRYNEEIEPQRVNITKEIDRRMKALRSNPLRLAYVFFNNLFDRSYFTLDREYRYDRKNKSWVLPGGILLEDKYGFNSMIKNRGYFKEFESCRHLLPAGMKGFFNICTHLHKQILDKFGIEVKDPSWQQWNGGVFLFSDEAHSFMESWHQKCLTIFDDKNWKTRDQGALIATTWEFHLENHDTLDERFNFIVDYHNPNLRVIQFLGLFSRLPRRWVRPEFVHVFYHLGNKSWPIWRYIEKRIRR